MYYTIERQPTQTDRMSSSAVGFQGTFLVKNWNVLFYRHCLGKWCICETRLLMWVMRFTVSLGHTANCFVNLVEPFRVITTHRDSAG